MAQNKSTLRAEPGDRLVIHPHHQGEPERDAEILEVLGEGGSPPYTVRWGDDGHVSRYYPSSDSWVEHFARSGLAAPRPSRPKA